jgi:hypothetical protein
MQPSSGGGSGGPIKKIESHSGELTHVQDAGPTAGGREEENKPHHRKNSGLPPQFPKLLHNMLGRADEGGYSSIVSWQPHGKSFLIRSRDQFVEQVMPLYFKQTRFASFQRQLNLYGFLRVERKGPDHKSYYHKCFLRDAPQLVETISRIQSKAGTTYANWAPNPEPDFSEKESTTMGSTITVAHGVAEMFAAVAAGYPSTTSSQPSTDPGAVPTDPMEQWGQKPIDTVGALLHSASPDVSENTHGLDQKLPAATLESSNSNDSTESSGQKDNSSMAVFLEDVDLDSQ